MKIFDGSLVIGVSGLSLSSLVKLFDDNSARVIALLTIISLLISIFHKLRGKKSDADSL